MAYIEIEKAIAEIDKGDLLVGDNAEWAKEILYRTPTADVVEVVRCEKCKHIEHTRKFVPYCKRMDEYADGDMLYEVSYDGFCNYGERKDT